MRGAAVRVIVIVLLAFLINIGVCWLLARRPWPAGVTPTFALPQPVPGAPEDMWQFMVSRCGGRSRFSFVLRRDAGREAAQLAAVRFGHDAAPSEVLPWWSSVRRDALFDSMPGYERAVLYAHIEEASGWPWRSGRTIQRMWWRDGTTWDQLETISGFELAPPTQNQPWGGRLLPVRPLVLGTVLNTTVYAGTLALLWLVLTGRVRRSWRRRRGRCAHCGYDLRGSHDRCPECGQSPAN